MGAECITNELIDELSSEVVAKTAQLFKATNQKPVNWRLLWVQ